MKEYIISLIVASFISAMIGILAPQGEGGGIAGHLRLLSALFLVAVIISPVGELLPALGDLREEIQTEHTPEDSVGDGYRDQLNGAVTSAAQPYFAALLIDTLEKEFSIPEGEVRCAIRWREEGESVYPERITVILSGSSIWRDPAPIEEFVRDRIGCACVSAIE